MMDYESEYETYRQSPEMLDLFAKWDAASALYRSAAGVQTNLVYGPDVRHRYDFAAVAGDTGPLIVYVHGGYWQGGNRNSYTYLAEAFNRRGYSVALPSYRLCPDVRVGDIADDLRLFLQHLESQTNGRPMVLIGHSAGAHLVSTLMMDEPRATRGATLAGVGISGVYELAPLIQTSLNTKLRLDEDEAKNNSPMLVDRPPSDSMFVAVGGAESTEFHRQSNSFAERYAHGIGSPLVIPERNHYTIVADLLDPSSKLSLLIAQAADGLAS